MAGWDMWYKKSCTCKICFDKGIESKFSTIAEGKRHVFLFHNIPMQKTREHLNTK